MLPHVRYLHGFGSGPRSEKAADLEMRLAGAYASFAVPDIEGDFTNMTMPGQRDRALATCPSDGSVVLIGSSLGGYLAAWIAAEHRLPNLAGLVLIAPAFGFTTRWAERVGAAEVAAWRATGSRQFFHFGEQRERPLNLAFLSSCEELPEAPGAPQVPCAIIHGRSDDSVDYRASLRFASAHPGVELHLVEGDHRLNAPRHAELIAWAARDLLARAAA